MKDLSIPVVFVVVVMQFRVAQSETVLKYLSQWREISQNSLDSVSSTCSWTVDGVEFDYSALKQSHSDYSCLTNTHCSSDGNNYFVGVCDNAISQACIAGGVSSPVCQAASGNRYFSCGSLDNPVVSAIDSNDVKKGLKIQYHHGSTCHPGTSQEHERSSEIHFECGEEKGLYSEQIDSSDDCKYILKFSSPKACAKTGPGPVPLISSSSEAHLHCKSLPEHDSSKIMRDYAYSSDYSKCSTTSIGSFDIEYGKCYTFSVDPFKETDCSLVEKCFGQNLDVAKFLECYYLGPLTFSLMWCEEDYVGFWYGTHCGNGDVIGTSDLFDAVGVCETMEECSGISEKTEKEHYSDSAKKSNHVALILSMSILGCIALLFTVCCIIFLIFFVAVVAFAFVISMKKTRNAYSRAVVANSDNVGDGVSVSAGKNAFQALEEAEAEAEERSLDEEGNHSSNMFNDDSIIEES